MTLRHTLLAGLAAVSMTLAACATIGPNAPLSDEAVAAQSAAIAASSRPQADRDRDVARRAAETLAFSRVEPGWRVADLMTGGGYFARLFAETVGSEGRVYAWQAGEFIAYQASYGDGLRAVDAAYETVTGTDQKAVDLVLPENLDLVFTAQNYHDLHLPSFPAGTADHVNRAVFNALKPGGLYVVIDHSATSGAGLGVAGGLHRIDIADVKREVLAAGFVLDAESEALANPADPRSASVFDDSIKGQTDQFMLRFRKPG